MKLVSLIFNGDCYNDWKCSTILSLSAKNQIRFVDGSIIKPGLHEVTYSVTPHFYNRAKQFNNSEFIRKYDNLATNCHTR